jgi:general secretion pathway protein A
MYETYWGLSSRPFDATADSRFHYPADPQQAALLKLRYVLEHRLGAAVLAGGSGLGKTLVAQNLVRQLDERFQPRLQIVYPDLPVDAFLNYLAGELTATAEEAPTRDVSLRCIEKALAENAANGKHAVLVIDEAHLLRESPVLQTLRLLLNLEHNGEPMLTLLLVAQPQLLTALDRFPEFNDRLAARCLLRRFNLEETCGYLQHRLTAAGAARVIFDDGACTAIHAASLGIPRRINRLADMALLVGYAEEHRKLSASHIEQIAEELTAVAPE